MSRELTETVQVEPNALQTNAKPDAQMATDVNHPPSGDRYRRRWRWDGVAKGTHLLNCWYQRNCAYNVYVKDGSVAFEEPAAESAHFLGTGDGEKSLARRWSTRSITLPSADEIASGATLIVSYNVAARCSLRLAVRGMPIRAPGKIAEAGSVGQASLVASVNTRHGWPITSSTLNDDAAEGLQNPPEESARTDPESHRGRHAPSLYPRSGWLSLAKAGKRPWVAKRA